MHTPKCKLCGMQTNPEVLERDHGETVLCRKGQDHKAQYAAVTTTSRAPKEKFATHGEGLKRIEMCKYLGCLMAHDNNNVRAVKLNLCKARKCWKPELKVLRSENVTP